MKHHFTERTLVCLIGGILFGITADALAATATSSTTVAVIGHAPVATPTIDNPTPQIGDTIHATVNFSDADGDAEYNSTYQWQIETAVGSGKFVDITGQTGMSYTVEDEAKGKKIAFMVIPRTNGLSTEPAIGVAAVSSSAPVAEAFSIRDIGLNIGGVVTYPSNVGFPESGFSGATFKLNTIGVVQDYAWSSSDNSLATVSADGQVVLVAPGKVTLTAIDKTGLHKVDKITYSFDDKVRWYYLSPGGTAVSQPQAVAFCNALGVHGRKYRLMELSDVSSTLLSEQELVPFSRKYDSSGLIEVWGNINFYPTSVIGNAWHWSNSISAQPDPVHGYAINIWSGNNSARPYRVDGVDGMFLPSCISVL